MAANATAVWRVRPSGSNTNGGGYDCSISSGATGTNGSFTGTTFTDAAALFTSGMVGRSINITGVGQYLITAFINSSNITLGSGNPGVVLSGGMAWTVGSGQDYSQQNGAQVSQLSTANTSTVTTTLTDTGAAFTLALIGNGIWVSGTSITTTFTYITAVPSGTTLTLQTSPGAAGTAVSYNIGGGWADFWTNTITAAAALVPGNTIYILGSGTPNPSSYTYDYTAPNFTSVFGNATAGSINYINDPGTPGYKAPPDTTGGMPCIKCNGNSGITMNYNRLIGLWGVAGAASKQMALNSGGSTSTGVLGCVFDQLSFNAVTAFNNLFFAIGCEVFSSNGGTGGSSYPVNCNVVIGCNIHDINGGGLTFTASGAIISDCIIAKNQLCGIKSFGGFALIKNNTIDGNLLHGIEIQTQAVLAVTSIMNNIISNHTVAGKFGTIVDAGTVTQNDSMTQGIVDYNVYYNNNADLSGIGYSEHDTHGGSNPYVGQTTENYTLA